MFDTPRRVSTINVNVETCRGMFTNCNKKVARGKLAQQFKTKSMRLKSWDYTTPWWYFVTITTQNHKDYFGEIINGQMQLNQIGKIAEYEWQRTAELRENVELDEFIIMPNHMHGIIILSENKTVETRRGVSDETLPSQKTRHGVSPQLLELSQEREFSKPIKDSLSTIINLYKGSVTKECNLQKHNFKWQPKFYDRIIRNQKELDNIRRYIQQNPLKWELEKGMPNNSEL